MFIFFILFVNVDLKNWFDSYMIGATLHIASIFATNRFGACAPFGSWWPFMSHLH